MFPIILIAIVIGVIVYFARSSAKQEADLVAHADRREAEVLTITQGLGRSGMKMDMTMVLNVPNPDGTVRRVECKTKVDYANIPRPHDKVFVLVDRRDPDRIEYKGLVANTLPPDTAYPIDLQALQQQGIAIGTFKSMKGTDWPAQFTVDIDSTVDPKREVTFQQDHLDYVPVPGERIYVFVKPDGTVQAVPLKLTGGRRSSNNANRLDPLVLGPQLLLHGRQAKGTVTGAERIWTNGQFARDAGLQRWHLTFHVVPYDQSAAYDAEQNLTFTTPERAAAVCHLGAEVALRIDWNDPHMLVTDSIAAGAPNPYPAFIERWNAAVASGNVDKI